MNQFEKCRSEWIKRKEAKSDLQWKWFRLKERQKYEGWLEPKTKFWRFKGYCPCCGNELEIEDIPFDSIIENRYILSCKCGYQWAETFISKFP